MPGTHKSGEFIELLEKNQVKYLVVGGYAVSVHGYPRFTGDLDIFIAIEPKNSRGILKTFRDFGFTDLEINESDFLEADTISGTGPEGAVVKDPRGKKRVKASLSAGGACELAAQGTFCRAKLLFGFTRP